MNGQGYRGQVTLESPTGERVTIVVPGRGKYNGKVSVYPWSYGKSLKQQNRRFERFLSAGYKVVKQGDKIVEEVKIGEEEKKDTDLVIGTTKTGDASHGGDHASGEVKDSPNRAKRGCRGGQKHRRNQDRKRSKERVRIQVQNAGQHGGAGVYSPQPLQFKHGILASAEKSAELLAELVGRSQLKVKRGVTIDVERLLAALELGDNPLPALESPDERPKLRILVTPDCSGSTQGWSGLGQAWAMHLSKIPDVDVMYFTNFNGELWEVEGDVATRKLIESADVVLYLGDGDGHGLCQRYASYGATVLALDSYCANYANPRLKTEEVGQGTLFWVDRVSAKMPETWTRAIELCLKH